MGEEIFFGFSGWEIIVVLLVFVVFIGPQRLPEYTQKAMGWIRSLRKWADESKASIEDEMGIAVDDLKKYDPRQYDPRRIIRDAWDSTGLEDDVKSFSDTVKTSAAGTAAAVSATSGDSTAYAADFEPAVGTPFDPEST